MPRAPALALALAFAAALLTLPAAAAAQQHPRRARISRLTSGDAPAVLIGRDRAWIPQTGDSERPLALCAERGCSPVREIRACAPPECPGAGLVVIGDGQTLADASELPRGREDFERELDRIFSDPELAPLAAYRSAHPEPPPPPPEPVRWLNEGRRGWGVGVWALGGLAYASLGDRAVARGDAAIGLRFSFRGDDELDWAIGNQLGVELRAHVIGPMLSPTAGEVPMVMIGAGPHLAYAEGDGIGQFPVYWGVAIPEVGVVFAPGLPTSVYVEWSVPFGMLVGPGVALQVRPSVAIVEEWAPGDDVGVIASIGAGLLFR